MALTVPLEPVTGRSELTNNNMLTLVAQGTSLFTAVNGLVDEEFLFMGGNRFGSTQRDVSFQIARNAAGHVVGLTWSADGRNGQSRGSVRCSVQSSKPRIRTRP